MNEASCGPFGVVLIDRQAVVAEHQARRRRGAVDVAVDEERAGDAAEDIAVDVVLDVGDRERRRLVAEACEGVVAHEEDALGEVAAAGDGEVPGQIEVVAFDAGGGERGEDLFHVGAARFLERRVGRGVVAIGEEVGARCDQRAAAVLDVAQRDDVARSFFEVGAGTNDQRARGVGGGVGVELAPHEVVLVVRGVDEHDGRTGVERARDVGDRRGAGLGKIDARHVQQDAGARAEAVVAVVVVGHDRRAHHVARHGVGRVVHAAAGVGAGIGDRQVVAGEREETFAAVEKVARTGAVGLAERGPAARRADRIALFAGIDHAVTADARRCGRRLSRRRTRFGRRRCRRRTAGGASPQRVVHRSDQLRDVDVALVVLKRRAGADRLQTEGNVHAQHQVVDPHHPGPAAVADAGLCFGRRHGDHAEERHGAGHQSYLPHEFVPSRCESHVNRATLVQTESVFQVLPADVSNL